MAIAKTAHKINNAVKSVNFVHNVIVFPFLLKIADNSLLFNLSKQAADHGRKPVGIYPPQRVRSMVLWALLISEFGTHIIIKKS